MSEILYLKDDQRKAYIINKEKEEEVKSINSFLGQLANKHFFSLAIYRKNIAKYLNITRLAPIYFNEHLILFKVLSTTGCLYWINYANLMSIIYVNGVCVFQFVGNYELKLAISKRKIMNIVNKINLIIDYINKI